ncbi:SDR family NAD(P)-dependent oxidoreductase [Sphingosinicellaceae bacterium]|nr:SDR family NAD(P)-dependent oxidoreductase [Sphingosinicellaceae bacterium]
MPRAIVIGASRGIGHELARVYAADGWEVIATVRRPEDGAALEALAGVEVAVADITDEASLVALAGRPGTIDLVVVNAGVGSREAGLDALDPAEWTRVMAVNALGPLLAAQALANSLKDGGSFVALSSMMGSIGGNSGGGSYSYRMSKVALNMALMNLAIAWKARRIAVAAIHPGWVKTAIGGAGAPVEVADSVAGMRTIIAGLTPTGRARFLDYRGNRLDW